MTVYGRNLITEEQAYIRETLTSSPRFFLICCLAAILFITMAPSSSYAHGIAGKRFFPTTLAVDDPFVSDELSFLLNYLKEPGEGDEGSTKTTELSLDYAKRITPNLGLSVGDAFVHLNPDNGSSESGFGNLELGLKYQFLKNDSHETILSIGLSSEIGGTGSKRIGAESFSVLSPTLFFGKGLGDLPEGVKFLRPFAITGVVGYNIPTRGSNVISTVNPDTGESEKEIERNPKTLSYGFTLQYNLQYLQSYVQDIGLKGPFKRMILIVEFPFETCLTNDCKGDTTGFVNPGILWFGKSMQLGIEAQIPINDRTGSQVGVLALLHFFIDDLFPNSLGKPIFGNEL
jgi:hypothetical protein